MKSYYNVDNILAEEETLPCISLFDFNNLGHLDLDNLVVLTPMRNTQDDTNKGPKSVTDDSGRKRKRRTQIKSYLPENSRVKMPLWSVEKWAKLGFVRLSIPRHFGRRARERLATDPGSAELRVKNERYFRSGVRLVNLIQECETISPAKAMTSNKLRRRMHTAAIQELVREAKDLRQTLLVTFTGERLRRTFDWTLGSVGDDVSMFTRRLTEMEMNLFQMGACAASAHYEWKNFGSKRIPVSTALLNTKQYTTPTMRVRAKKVTPEKETDQPYSKIQRVL